MKDGSSGRRSLGSKPQPMEEELEFVYQKIADGLSDSGIREDFQDQPFSRVPNKRYLKQRRREYNAARRVLQDLAAAAQDPLVQEKRREHIEFLTTMLDRLPKSAIPEQLALQPQWEWRGAEAVKRDIEGDGLLAPKGIDDDSLREHMAGTEIWAMFEKLDATLKELRLAEQKLYGFLLEELKRLPLPAEAGAGGAAGLIRSLADSLFRHVSSLVLDQSRDASRLVSYKTTQSTDDRYELRAAVDDRPLASGTPDQIESLKDALMRLKSNIEAHPEVASLRRLLSEFGPQSRNLDKAIDLLKRSRAFSGRCKICSRWGGLGGAVRVFGHNADGLKSGA